jgi:hypothetical protein
MVGKKNKERTKEEEEKGGSFLKSKGKVGQWKEKKTHLDVWFGSGWMFWVHLKTAKPASSTIGAMVGAGSQQPGTGVQKLFPVHALSTSSCLLIVHSDSTSEILWWERKCVEEKCESFDLRNHGVENVRLYVTSRPSRNDSAR